MNKIKGLLLLAGLLSVALVHAQDAASVEDRLLAAFRKIKDYRVEEGVSEDSVAEANMHFQEALIKVLKREPDRIRYPFEQLRQAHLNIFTSADGKLRVYNWDDNMGGTMRDFRTVVQLVYAKGKQSVFAWEEGGALVNDLYVLRQGEKACYLVSTTAIGSSALTGETIGIYTISDSGRLVAAPMIKTASGFSSRLSCEVDYSAAANRDRPRIRTKAVYNTDRKELSIPLILGDGGITSRSIVYRFNGTRFEKVK